MSDDDTPPAHRPVWQFERESSTRGSSEGEAGELVLWETIQGFVREVVQNLNDEGPVDEERPVEGIIHINEFTGTDLQEFLEALQWSTENAEAEALGEHVELAAERDDVIADFIENVDEEGRLLLVTIEDRNARGLVGELGGDGNFAALVQDTLNNQTDESGSGGSVGVGHMTYRAWSGISTVLFTSVLSEPNPRDDGPRFIGQTKLPTHDGPSTDGVQFEGLGYFGNAQEQSRERFATDDDAFFSWGETGQPASLWESRADTLVDDLGIPRDRDEYGTSITVVGFSRPGETTQPDGTELTEEMANAVSKWFWPAIANGDLTITIDGPDESVDVDARYYEPVVPFVDCFERRRDATESLDRPGDIAVESLSIDIPPLADGTETPVGEADLYVRLADSHSEGPEADLRDKVALIRGSGMVVKYYDQSNVVYGDREFNAVLLAGLARSWGTETTDADRALDDFLKAAEPPAHTDWKSDELTRNLREQYGRGPTARISELKSDITTIIKNLLGSASTDGEQVAAQLADRLGITGRGEPPEPERVVSGDVDLQPDGSSNGWRFEGSVSPVPDDHGPWEVHLELNRVSESGKTLGTVDIENVTSLTGDVEVDDDGPVAILEAPASVGEVHFEGTSVPDSQGETRLDVTGRVATGGEIA